MATVEEPTWRSEANNDISAQEYDSESETPEKKRRCCNIGRKNVMKGLFSHVGITAIVIAYSIIGGFVFQHLEETNEKASCIQLMDKYTPVENKTMLNLWEISRVYVNEFFCF